jgi:mycothiol synthase
MIRVASSDADLEAHVEVWNAITPDEPTTVEKQLERDARDPRRLKVLAEREGTVVGTGFCAPSDAPRRAFVEPRVLLPFRRAGIGTALLGELVRHTARLDDFEKLTAYVDGSDEGSLAFARRFGFEEVDRQVEQVRELGDEAWPEVPDGIRLVTIAEQPELLRELYDLATEGYADLALTEPISIPLEEWLSDEATLPGGSFVAFSGDEIVGYSGLIRRPQEGIAEDGLTVVRRAWRRRGLATLLKRAELAWAGENGIREVVTWTQRGNEGMRAANEALGYTYRAVSVTMHAPLEIVLERVSA